MFKFSIKFLYDWEVCLKSIEKFIRHTPKQVDKNMEKILSQHNWIKKKNFEHQLLVWQVGERNK